MADIRCVVCGEPFNAYGIDHGDLLHWEARLFKQGAGCPCCEGVKPENMTDEDEYNVLADRLLFNPDEDGDLDLIANLSSGQPRPAWKRPEPEVLKTCEGCGVKLVRDPDDGEEVLEGAYGSNRAWESLSGRDYCSVCYAHCRECDELVIIHDDEIGPDDSHYAYSVGVYGNEHYCSDCNKTRRSEDHARCIRETTLPRRTMLRADVPDTWVEEARADVEIVHEDSDGSVIVREMDVFEYLCKRNWLLCDECEQPIAYHEIVSNGSRPRDTHVCSSIYEKLADINPDINPD